MSNMTVNRFVRLFTQTNSFTEYNEIYHSATDSFLSHYYADGRMNTLLTYFTYETFDSEWAQLEAYIA